MTKAKLIAYSHGKYYKLGDDENSSKDTSLSFDNNTLSSGKITFSGLSSDTTYVVKVYHITPLHKH